MREGVDQSQASIPSSPEGLRLTQHYEHSPWPAALNSLIPLSNPPPLYQPLLSLPSDQSLPPILIHKASSFITHQGGGRRGGAHGGGGAGEEIGEFAQSTGGRKRSLALVRESSPEKRVGLAGGGRERGTKKGVREGGRTGGKAKNEWQTKQ